MMDMFDCKKKLAILWFLVCGILFLLMFFQFNHYGSYVDEAWGWLISSILPTLSLIISVFTVDALTEKRTKKSVDVFFFRLTFSLSAVYLLLILLMIILQPFMIGGDPSRIIEQMRKSHKFMGPLQGMVVATLGIFFTRQSKLST